MTLKYVKKIKGIADKYIAKNGTCKRILSVNGLLTAEHDSGFPFGRIPHI